MDISKLALDKWLQHAPDTAYPNHQKFDYHSLHAALRTKTANLHKNVAQTGNYQESIKTGGILSLNDHGEEHIKRVIQRATDLLKNCRDGSDSLTPKEVYYLLCAIEIHDLGNFYGRSGHEKELPKVIQGLGSLIGLDDVERRYIRQIAEAHGGKDPGGDRDKIVKLEKIVNTGNEKVRLQLLAAALRFADELADDKSRANIKALDEGLLAKQSEVYHAYSKCLDSVTVDHNKKEIQLNFEIPVAYAVRKFGKEDKEVFLIDEIYDRVLKMHLERIYTMNFMKGYCDIESIWVRIRFYKSFLDNEDIPPITFELKERGYPDLNGRTIYDICDNLIKNGRKMDGEYFKQILNKTNEPAKESI